MFLTIISPVYKAEKILPQLVKQTENAAKQITDSYEIILVEDNSPDKSRQIIKEICLSNKCVKGIFLSRNFGQQYAINAGFDNACGDWVISLDCDLQDNPNSMIALFNKAQEGYDIVYASRQNRQDGFIKKLGSKFFSKLIAWMTDTDQDESIANFVLYKAKVIKAMKAMGDYQRYYPLMNHWVGFSSFVLPIAHAARADDQASSYSFRARISLALNIAISFSDKPLRMVILLGLLITSFSFLFAIFFIVLYLTTNTSVSGWLTLFVSIWFVAGVMIVLLGIIAIYIGKTYQEIKHRPTYIISDKVNFND